MNISELLARNARKYPEREAIVNGAERVTYRTFDQDVNTLAYGLRELGISQGDKVVLFMPNTKEFLYTYIAVMRLGAVIVPVNAKLTGTELDYILGHSDAKAVFVHEHLFPVVEALALPARMVSVKTGAAVEGWISFEALLSVPVSEEFICQMKEDDEATILYTSGTTGKPKGVVFTYRNILTAATMMCIEMTMNTESRILHMMPLSHSAPLHLFFVSGLYVGAAHILAPVFTPELLLDLASREKITHFFGAPVAYLFTAKHPRIAEYDLSSAKYWVYGGAPLGTKEVQVVQQAFQTENLVCVYGLTEAGPNGTLLKAEEHAHKAGSIGRRAALNCELRIVDADGKDVAGDEVGEIVLRGEGTMKGYYKDEELTADTIRGGWLYTGDMARFDGDGYIWVVDRKKDIIISGGVNIFPKEIEDVLSTHPAIAEVAVVGVPHPEWGETVKAFIVPATEMADIEIECKRFLKGKLADYKIPKLYETIAQLPRNATGKIIKTTLREVKTQEATG
ncbi:class I adenylate-forming enzyme family protein [Aneurinibacillus sp. UBA3580]|jgi:acyl-CoA synthetase (AMP-forming)/AMP-acid ligase II|uniref:class I adenylate-forming enzyme family protein n=1 Tax=Aneurinibacillus sp. UBA3580 TaxID=1946041 RepID=UPI00257EF981|nr:long-chain-fatty-acid--CoA ligase [Aneurinibacillus sp. UBA3580]